jgi:CRISPR-associated protein Cst2
MTLHVFGAIVTGHGTAANNRGITEGNITTLQKLLWKQQVHTTMSAETIRFALRRYLGEHEGCNRTYNETERTNTWADPEFKRWSAQSKDAPFIDDDLLGYMAAEAAKEENTKGSAKIRRAVLEITRSISLTPWPGDVTFNAASPGATPSAQKKGSNPVPYGTEMHATRYQYGFAMTPSKIHSHKAKRARIALEGLCSLAEVAGNHGRFLFDYSPESVVFRLTDDPAPRILYAFEATADGRVGIADLIRKVKARDVRPEELIVGGAIAPALDKGDRVALEGAKIFDGVRAACEAACKRIEDDRSLS